MYTLSSWSDYILKMECILISTASILTQSVHAYFWDTLYARQAPINKSHSLPPGSFHTTQHERERAKESAEWKGKVPNRPRCQTLIRAGSPLRTCPYFQQLTQRFRGSHDREGPERSRLVSQGESPARWVIAK